jgi:uncharacterized membrane protein
MMDWSDDNGWMTGWGVGFMIVVWITLIVIGVLLVLRATGGGESRGVMESPRQILDRRLASGELTAAEYTAACDLLEGRTRGTTPPPG